MWAAILVLMSRGGYPYNESLLQWIWQHLEFNTRALETECGLPVQIIHTGSLNSGAGPDFRGSALRIGGIDMHGDTELHITPGEWASHNHFESKRYNRVILHVVYSRGSEKGRKSVLRPDGTTPPLLVLKPYLQKSLCTLFEQRKESGLPCRGNVNFINQSAFEHQIEKAHRNYFEYKVDFLLSHYNGSLPVSDAWTDLFTAGIFHTLGIPVNRGVMVQLHKNLSIVSCSEQLSENHSQEEFIKRVNSAAFEPGQYSWSHTGMRPASRPETRVRQAAAILYAVNSLPFKEFLSPGLSAWDSVLRSVHPAHLPGRQMLNILKHTIYLPAAYLLGDLLHSEGLKNSAYSEWRSLRGGVPEEVAAPFKKSGFKINKQTRKAGLAHQLKRFCREGNCHQCEVFKKAISS